MSRTWSRRTAILVLAVGMLMVTLTLGFGIARILSPTYEYDGEVLTAAEFLELFNRGVPLHCVQIPHAVFDQIGFAVAYACFNSQEEADAYARGVSRAE